LLLFVDFEDVEDVDDHDSFVCLRIGGDLKAQSAVDNLLDSKFTVCLPVYLSRLVLSCLVLFCLVLSCRILFCLVLSCFVLSAYSILGGTVL
jgi:hypothetical protein